MAWRGLAGGAAGAAAYNTYQSMDTGLIGNTGIASGLYDAIRRGGAQAGTESAKMQKQIEDLQSMLLKSFQERSSGSSTIVIQSPNKTSASTALGFAVIVGGAVMYVRFVKGWKLTDLMYVTRSSLTNLKTSMADGIQKMQDQVRSTTEELQKRLRTMTKKQDDLMDSQQQMDATLKRVEDNVGEVNHNVYLLQDQVAYSNQAVTLLCGAVAEVAKRVNINGRYTRALEGLTRVAPPALPGMPGFVALEAPGGAVMVQQQQLGLGGGGVLLLEQERDEYEYEESEGSARQQWQQPQGQQGHQQGRQGGQQGQTRRSGGGGSSGGGAAHQHSGNGSSNGSSSGNAPLPPRQQQQQQQGQGQQRFAGGPAPNPAVYIANDAARSMPGISDTSSSGMGLNLGGPTSRGPSGGGAPSPSSGSANGGGRQHQRAENSPFEYDAGLPAFKLPEQAKRAEAAPPARTSSTFGSFLRRQQ